MGQPVKVSQLIYNALEFAKHKIEGQLANEIPNYYAIDCNEREEMVFTEMVSMYARDMSLRNSDDEEMVSIHDFTLRQFVRALDYGYEVDRTPEEQLAAYFKMVGRTQDEIEAATENEDDIAPGLSESQAVILAVLGILGIRIAGVNA